MFYFRLDHASAVLAMEYGNELDVTNEVSSASTPQIVAWCQVVTEAYKYPCLSPLSNYFVLFFLFLMEHRNTFELAGVGIPLVVAGTDRSMAHEGFPLGQAFLFFSFFLTPCLLYEFSGLCPHLFNLWLD